MLWFGLACIAGFGLTSRVEDQAGKLVVGLIGKACFRLTVGCSGKARFGLAIGCTGNAKKARFACNLSSGTQPNLILLNFKKAFDEVPHHHLCYKLCYYGVKGTTFGYIKDFLINRTQQVIIDGYNSSLSQVIFNSFNVISLETYREDQAC